MKPKNNSQEVSLERIRIAYSVERRAYSKNKKNFYSCLSAIRYHFDFAQCPSPKCLEPVERPLSAKKGFTFIEMLIVIVMLSVISLAIYSSLSNGVKIWQRIYARQAIEEDMDIFWDRFTHDLKNTVSFLPIDFFGEKDTLSFATIVNSRELQKTTVGKVSYAFNQQAGIINRKQADFSRIFEGREPEVTHSLKDIKSLKFQYYYYHNENKEYLWQDEADKGLPLAVRVECEYVDGPNSDTFVRTVSIPIAA